MDNSAAAKSARYRAKDIEAYRKRKREYAKTEAQRDARNKYMREYYHRPNVHEKFLAYRKRYNLKNKAKINLAAKEYNYKIKYGLSISQKNLMIESQNGLCAICNIKFKDSRNTHVDHCHITNIVRGILCNVCNTKLGWYEKLSKNIIFYLGKYKNG